jgi:hypothetical protein
MNNLGMFLSSRRFISLGTGLYVVSVVFGRFYPKLESLDTLFSNSPVSDFQKIPVGAFRLLHANGRYT